MRILLVEDDRSLSRAVSTILQKNNYSVDCVENGQTALDYLEKDTNKEYQIMLMFMNNKTQVISAEHFMEKIWDSESDSDISTVWTYISYLRRKLEALKSDYSIATRRNMGYYLKNNN